MRLVPKGDTSMRNSRWTRLAAGVMLVCLAMVPCQATPATQAASMQRGPVGPRFELVPGDYPPGVRMQSSTSSIWLPSCGSWQARLRLRAEAADENVRMHLDVAIFALTRVAEPYLTQAWLWHRDGRQAGTGPTGVVSRPAGPVRCGRAPPNAGAGPAVSAYADGADADIPAGDGKGAGDAAGSRGRPCGRRTWRMQPSRRSRHRLKRPVNF